MRKYAVLLLSVLVMSLLAGCVGRGSSKIQHYRMAEVYTPEEEDGVTLFSQVLSDYTGRWLTAVTG